MKKIINRLRNARRWTLLGQPVASGNRLNSDASKHQQVPVAHQLTRRVQLRRSLAE